MLEWILEAVRSYPGLFGISAVTGILIPVPEDVVVIWAGVLVADGVLVWLPTLLIVSAGSFIRDTVVFWVGRLFGGWLLKHRRFVRIIGASRIARANRLIEGRGSASVFIARFMVGMRVPIFFVAGALGLSRRKFAAWDALGMLPSTAILLWLGVNFGHPVLNSVHAFATGASRSLAVVGALGAVGAVLWYRRAGARSDAQLRAEAEAEEQIAAQFGGELDAQASAEASADSTTR